MNRRWFAIVAVVAIAATSTWWMLTRRAPQEAAATATPAVPTLVAQDGSLERSLRATGRVGSPAGLQTKLAFAISGVLASVDVSIGQHVSAGQTIAQLDATSQQLAAGAANADLRAADANVASARVDRVSARLHVDLAQLNREQRLFDAGVAARKDVEAAQATLAADRADAATAQANLDAARAQARSASARAALAQTDVSRGTLRAPSDGVVVAVYARPGATVDPTVPVAAIAPFTARTATLDVPVGDVTNVSTGAVVHLRAGATTWESRVVGIAPVVDPATGLALVTVDGVPASVAAGTPIDAQIVTGHADGLVIPASAIVQDPESGDTLVFVQSKDKDGNLHFDARRVTIDAEGDGQVRVAGGLRAGDRFAARGAIELLAPQ